MLDRYPRFVQELSNLSPSTRMAYSCYVGRFLREVGPKGPEEFSVDDVLRFLSIVKSPIYGRRGPAYHCKVVTALLKFMKTVGARSEVIEYLSGLLDSLSKEVTIYYDQKYLDEGFMRMRVLTDEERDLSIPFWIQEATIKAPEVLSGNC